MLAFSFLPLAPSFSRSYSLLRGRGSLPLSLSLSLSLSTFPFPPSIILSLLLCLSPVCARLRLYLSRLLARPLLAAFFLPLLFFHARANATPLRARVLFPSRAPFRIVFLPSLSLSLYVSCFCSKTREKPSSVHPFTSALCFSVPPIYRKIVIEKLKARERNSNDPLSLFLSPRGAI